jgi:hypothetical protein
MHQKDFNDLPTLVKVAVIFGAIAFACIVLVAFIPNW